MAEDLLGDIPNDNNFQAEEFEKVEKIPEQDEAVSSSILEDAEEDRYDPGNLGTVDNFPDLMNLGPAISSFAQSDSFGQSPQPTAPPKEERDLVSAFEDTVLKSEPQPEVPKPSVAESPKTSSTSPPSETASWLKNVDPRVLELIYWRDYKKTGVVFGSMLFVLLSLAICSVLSVLAYLSLAVLSVTISFRIYKNVLAAVQKSGDAHPFKMLLEMDISMPEDKAQEALTTICKHINCTVKELRRLFLIEDIVDSLKFALLLWVLTYIGSWFNGMTLIIMGLVAIFTLPKVYETYQVQIDNYVAIAAEQVGNIKAQVVSKVPFLKKKEKSQ